MPDIRDMIPIADYAAAHGVDRTVVFRKIKSERLPAVKVGAYWLIDKDEPYIDHRIKDGSYIGDRVKRRARQTQKGPATDEDI